MSQFIASRGFCASISAIYRNDTAMEVRLLQELQNQFRGAYLDAGYPFGEFDYRQRAKHKTMHLCPKRLAWAKDHYVYPRTGQSVGLTAFYRAWYEWAVSVRPAYEQSLNQAMINAMQVQE